MLAAALSASDPIFRVTLGQRRRHPQQVPSRGRAHSRSRFPCPPPRHPSSPPSHHRRHSPPPPPATPGPTTTPVIGRRRRRGPAIVPVIRRQRREPEPHPQVFPGAATIASIPWTPLRRPSRARTAACPSASVGAEAGSTAASGTSSVNRNTTARPSTGRPSVSSSCTTRGSVSASPSGPRWPSPATMLSAAGSPGPGSVRSSPPQAAGGMESRRSTDHVGDPHTGHATVLATARLCGASHPRVASAHHIGHQAAGARRGTTRRHIRR